MFYEDNTKRKLLTVIYVALCYSHTVHTSLYFSLRKSTRALIHVENNLGTFPAGMELQCARSCWRNPLCSTIAVGTGDQVCVVLSRIATGLPHIGGSDWVNYETDHDDCPTSDSRMYVRELGACYWVHPKGLYSVYDSIDICEKSNGHLVKVDSEMKQMVVEDLIGEDHDRAHIQGNDTLEEGVWRFDDGSRMPYLNWFDGMPRNKTHFNFLLIRRAHEFKWQDTDGVPNTEGISVICEKYLV